MTQSFFYLPVIISFFDIFSCIYWCSDIPADGDNLKPELTTTDDYLKQQEEEIKQRLELEADERKLEETLEYQRRIEEEAKQKLLAEQSKNASVTSSINPLGQPWVFGKDINLDRQSLIHNTSPAVFFGDFGPSEAGMLGYKSIDRSNRPDQMPNSQDNSTKKHDGVDTTEIQPFSLTNTLPTKRSSKMNGTDRITSSSSSSIQKIKKTDSQPYVNHNQGYLSFLPFNQQFLFVKSSPLVVRNVHYIW